MGSRQAHQLDALAGKWMREKELRKPRDAREKYGDSKGGRGEVRGSRGIPFFVVCRYYN